MKTTHTLQCPFRAKLQYFTFIRLLVPFFLIATSAVASPRESLEMTNGWKAAYCERIDEQLAVTGLLASLGRENVYRGDERVGAALAHAEADAAAWVASRAG